MSWWRRWRARRWVNPIDNEIWKFYPSIPPSKGDRVLVDGERCRVVRAIVRWSGCRWTLDGVQVEPLA